jgi:hypothetical protein
MSKASATIPRDSKEWKALKAFSELIEATIRDLNSASMPAQLAAAVDARLGAWEAADAEFAAVLKQIKGQVWSMETAHLRAIRERIVGHLETNLADVKGRLGT